MTYPASAETIPITLTPPTTQPTGITTPARHTTWNTRRGNVFPRLLLMVVLAITAVVLGAVTVVALITVVPDVLMIGAGH